TYEIDAGMRVVHGTDVISRIQSSKFFNARPKTFELSGERRTSGIFETTPPIVTDGELRHALQDVFRVRSVRIGDIGREHGYFETVLANGGNQARQLLLDARGLHVAALSNCEVNAVETHVSRGLRQLLALQKEK